MQWGITKRTQINSSWMDITACLVQGLQNVKTGNDGMECIEKQSAHSICPSHTPHWFASTLPIRESSVSDGQKPTSADFTCWIGANNVRVAPKASNAAEHTKHICSWPRPSLPQRCKVQRLGRCVPAFSHLVDWQISLATILMRNGFFLKQAPFICQENTKRSQQIFTNMLVYLQHNLDLQDILDGHFSPIFWSKID